MTNRTCGYCHHHENTHTFRTLYHNSACSQCPCTSYRTPPEATCIRCVHTLSQHGSVHGCTRCGCWRYLGQGNYRWEIGPKNTSNGGRTPRTAVHLFPDPRPWRDPVTARRYATERLKLAGRNTVTVFAPRSSERIAELKISRAKAAATREAKRRASVATRFRSPKDVDFS